jgi:NADPH2:quinone reductase
VRAVTIAGGRLEWRDRPAPSPGRGQLLVEVHAAGLNAADLLQVQGLYPAPPGVPPDIPGLELAGVVAAVGPGVTRFAGGERVMAVVGGGAQAELALVEEDEALAVPPSVGWDQAGAFPEAFSTAHDALFTQCGLALGDRVLVTGAAGGVGTAAVQLAAAAGAEVVASVRRPELRDAVRALGAAAAVDPAEAGSHGPFDVVLELVGGEVLASSLQALGTGGRLAVIGVGAGARVEVDVLGLMARRAVVRGSTLRARPPAAKAAVARAVEAHVVPLFGTGRLRVPVEARFPLAQAAAAYERFAAGGKLGKVVLLRDGA